MNDNNELCDWDVDIYENNISQANKADLLQIFKSYNIKFDNSNCKITCPLHNGGNEKTPSFKYYEKSNSFYCFGCKETGHAVEFVSLYEGISKTKAAEKILNNFDLIEKENKKNKDHYDKTLLLINFSNQVREQIKTLNTEYLNEYENTLKSFDIVITKHNPNKNGIMKIIDKIRFELNQIYEASF
jgi:DNA primase